MDSTNLICPACHAIAVPGSKFCATCGHMLIPAPTTVSIGRQIWIYFVSLALPPLGLIWTFKYFFSPYGAIKRVGFIALLLTIISIVVTIWISVGFFQTVQQQVNSYQNLGL